VRAAFEEENCGALATKAILALRVSGQWKPLPGIQEAQENGYSPALTKPPILRDFATAVLKRIDNSSLDPDTNRYYRNGWSRLETTPLAGMRLNWITSEAVDDLQLDGSPSWQNQALRTLSVILTKAVELRYVNVRERNLLLQRATGCTRVER
jgi:hypothetical protein